MLRSPRNVIPAKAGIQRLCILARCRCQGHWRMTSNVFDSLFPVPIPDSGFLDVLPQPDAVPLPHLPRSLRTRHRPGRSAAQAGRPAGTVLARLRLAVRPRRATSCSHTRTDATPSGSPSAARTSCCRPRWSTTCWRRSSPRSSRRKAASPAAARASGMKDDLITSCCRARSSAQSRTDAMLDLEHGLCRRRHLLAQERRERGREIRHALGSFPALPLNAEVAPRSVLTGWIAGEPLPDGLSLGDECELQGRRSTRARSSSASARNCRATRSPSTWKPASRSRAWR